jgi:hypothetical protein
MQVTQKKVYVQPVIEKRERLEDVTEGTMLIATVGIPGIKG